VHAPAVIPEKPMSIYVSQKQWTASTPERLPNVKVSPCADQLGKCKPQSPWTMHARMSVLQLFLLTCCQHKVSSKPLLLIHHLTKQTLQLGLKQIVLTFLDMFCDPLQTKCWTHLTVAEHPIFTAYYLNTQNCTLKNKARLTGRYDTAAPGSPDQAEPRWT
jgi:hypothetical protein